MDSSQARTVCRSIAGDQPVVDVFLLDHRRQHLFWAVQVGEIGNLSFVARFESAARLGATLEAINTDPAFAAWRAKNLKAGLATWVRSNQAYEIPLQ